MGSKQTMTESRSHEVLRTKDHALSPKRDVCISPHHPSASEDLEEDKPTSVQELKDGRGDGKCWLWDMARLRHSRTPSGCGYLQKICRRPSQLHHLLLAVVSYCLKENHSLKMWPVIGFSCSPERLPHHAYMNHTNMTL